MMDALYFSPTRCFLLLHSETRQSKMKLRNYFRLFPGRVVGVIDEFYLAEARYVVLQR